MKFVFTSRFLWLFALGMGLLSLSWINRNFYFFTIAFDITLFGVAYLDYFKTKKFEKFTIQRICEGRFSISIDNVVTIKITNPLDHDITLQIKDEFPNEMVAVGREKEVTIPAHQEHRFQYTLLVNKRGSYTFGNIAVRCLGYFQLIWKQSVVLAETTVKIYPNIQEAKKYLVYAQRHRELRLGQHRIRHKGQGREFESLREFVTGDEIRHICWPATARRSKLVTRQYQVERSQNVLVMLDCGRLMTSRINNLTKLDYAINATLSIVYVAIAAGDNVGILSFCRQVKSFLPPKSGRNQITSALESLYNLQAELIEPSYTRAFNYLRTNCNKRSLVIILTDIVDRDGSADLLAHTTLLLPRHLPIIVTIGDKNLRSFVKEIPQNAEEVFEQSVAEEILTQREGALKQITQRGGLALDTPTATLSIELINKYLEVKERGLL